MKRQKHKSFDIKNIVYYILKIEIGTLYWASDGEVLWISQMYIEPEYRKRGVFFKIISKLREENKDIKIVSCATSENNERMQKSIV